MKGGVGKGSGKFSQDRNVRPYANINFKGNLSQENHKGFQHDFHHIADQIPKRK